MMCVSKTVAAALLILLLSGCAASATEPPEPADRDAVSVSALFRAETGEMPQGSVVQFSTQETSYSLDSSGEIHAQGLPRNGETLLTLFDRQQKVQGTMTLSFAEGAVIDATTGEDGVGHITVRTDTDEVALLFDLKENGGLSCTLWLKQAQTPDDGAEGD